MDISSLLLLDLPSWVSWVFSGIGVLFFGYLVDFFFKKKKVQTKEENQKDSVVPPKKKVYSEEELKLRTHILFVDDESFKIVKILKTTEGWTNTKAVKDIKSLSATEVKWANIIFVDVNGVGSALFNDQGLGLAAAIKMKYPEKKVIIYSAESKRNVFNDSWDKVDKRLSKNADPIQFISIVETFANQIFNE